MPFCRTKCSFCNFASGVVSKVVFTKYVDRVVDDVERAREFATRIGARFDSDADSVYLGGGTPTVLDGAELERIFDVVRRRFDVAADAEVTVECAPGTLTDAMVETLLRCGVNRVSLGVQSFVDEESRSVGRLHTRAITLDDIARLRAAGITNLSLDLIAGLPHQTHESWDYSLGEMIATGVPHVSVYMLEVDEDSRLGSELMAGGSKYHAHFVPHDDTTAELYERACERLNAADIQQYEISNFARAGWESKHNLKYWTRQPYAGFGVDAHSMLRSADPAVDALRFATTDSLEEYVAAKSPTITPVDRDAAEEEAYFLGLRLTQGVNPKEIGRDFTHTIDHLVQDGLLECLGERVRLTHRGRLLSNEVFQGFVGEPVARQARRVHADSRDSNDR